MVIPDRQLTLPWLGREELLPISNPCVDRHPTRNHPEECVIQTCADL